MVWGEGGGSRSLTDTSDRLIIWEICYSINMIQTFENKSVALRIWLFRHELEKAVSFFKLYEKTGKELCVVVTNLNHMTEEYCHVKTTPDMPIRLAVRMSMAIPGN